MTMLKGYSIPRPGAGDGEYGGFGDYNPVGFAAYAQSPANHPYWEGQGIARTIPALNGYGMRLTGPDFYTDNRGKRVYISNHSAGTKMHGYGEDPSIPLAGSVSPVTAGVVGAIAGYLNGGVSRGLMFGALAYFVAEKVLPPAPMNGYGYSEETYPHGEAMNPAGPTTAGAAYSTGADGLQTSADSSLGNASPSGAYVKLALGGAAAYLAWKFIF